MLDTTGVDWLMPHPVDVILRFWWAALPGRIHRCGVNVPCLLQLLIDSTYN